MLQEVIEETAQQLHAFVPKSGNTGCSQQRTSVQHPTKHYCPVGHVLLICHT